MIDRIRALLASLLEEATRTTELAALDNDALDGVHQELRDAYASIRAGEMEGVEATDVETLRSIREAVTLIEAEQGVRAEAASIAAAELAELDAAMTPTEAPTEPETPEGGEPTGDEPPADPAPAEPEAAAEPVVAAPARPARPSLAALAANRPAAAAPVVRPGEFVARPRWQSLDGRTFDQADIALRINEAQGALLSAPAGFADKVVVARVKVDYPEERFISEGDDAVRATQKVEAVTAGSQDPATYEDPEVAALVAAGGFCAPPEPRYDIANVSSADRPVRNGLPRFGASRGAVTFVRSGGLSSITVAGNSRAVSIWDNANDILPASPTTKPYQTFACRSAVTATLQAIVARGRFGNFMGRAFPELVADDVNLMMAAHARLAEVELLDAIIESINVDLTQTGFFGTMRDLRQTFQQAASQMRSTERMATGSRFRALLAREALDMMQQDVFFQTASGELEALRIDEAQVRAILALSGVNVAYAMDTPTGADAFVANADSQNLADYPDNFIVPIFPEGTVAFLDGGQLDLGIVRDSTLNNTNDYEMFVETFEAAAWLGPRALTLTLTTCPNGDSQLPVRVTSVCAGS